MGYPTLAVALMLAGVRTGAPPAKSTGADAEMRAMDTNGDGKLTPEEHAAGARRMFETMDLNTDKKVTAVEMEAAHERVTGRKPAPGDMSAADKIKAVDTDHDGFLTAEEHASGAKAMFERMDTNKDGALTKEELSAGHAKLM